MSGNQPPRPAGKPDQGRGISPADAQQLRARLDSVEKQVRAHSEAINDRNNWNAVVRGWIGSQVSVHTVSGATVTGILKWVDRYTLCVEGIVGTHDPYSAKELQQIVLHKGALEMLYQVQVTTQ